MTVMDNYTNCRLSFNPLGELYPVLHVSKGVFNIASRLFEVTKLAPDGDSSKDPANMGFYNGRRKSYMD